MHKKKAVINLQVFKTEVKYGDIKRAIENFLKGISKMKCVCIFRDASLKHPEGLNSVGRSRQIICIMSLTVNRLGLLDFAYATSS